MRTFMWSYKGSLSLFFCFERQIKNRYPQQQHTKFVRRRLKSELMVRASRLWVNCFQLNSGMFCLLMKPGALLDGVFQHTIPTFAFILSRHSSGRDRTHRRSKQANQISSKHVKRVGNSTRLLIGVMDET